MAAHNFRDIYLFQSINLGTVISYRLKTVIQKYNIQINWFSKR